VEPWHHLPCQVGHCLPVTGPVTSDAGGDVLGKWAGWSSGRRGACRRVCGLCGRRRYAHRTSPRSGPPGAARSC
jgi:hypothetical protein